MKIALTVLAIAFMLTLFGCPESPQPTAQKAEEAEPALIEDPAPPETSVQVAKDTSPKTPAPKWQVAVGATPAREEKPLPKLYDFWATWCPPCREQKPIIEELKKEYAGVVDVIAIDTDKDKELAQKYAIKVIPTLILVDAHGKEVERITGLTQKDRLIERFRAHGFIE